jgi:signal transduction histidine kinase
MTPRDGPLAHLDRRVPAPIAVSAALIGLVLLSLPVAEHVLPTIPGFGPAWAALLFGCALLTTFLLVSQYAVVGSPRLLVLSFAFLWDAAVVFFYGFSVPGMLSADPTFAADNNSLQYLWLERHLGPPLVAGLALAPWPQWLVDRTSRDANRPRTALAVLGSAAVLWAGMGLSIDRFGPDLPLLQYPDGHYATWAVALVLGVNLAAAAAATVGVLQRRLTSGLERWGLVAIVACLGDVVLTLLHEDRSTVAYYLARGLALAASVTIVLAMLQQLAHLHRRVRQDAVVLEKQNAELREGQSLRVHLVAIVSHEMRTPLAGLQGYLELLQDDVAGLDPALRSRMLERSWLLARRLTLLTEDLLAVATLEHGDLVITPSRVDLRTQLEECAQVFPDLLIRIECPDDTALDADPLRLQQILGNLVRNSQKHGAEPVIISAEVSADAVILKVTDAGAGVPAEFVPRLFDRYTQAVEGSAGGSGLGLSVVRDLVASHRGTVVYESESNTFVVMLPNPSPLVRRVDQPILNGTSFTA